LLLRGRRGLLAGRLRLRGGRDLLPLINRQGGAPRPEALATARAGSSVTVISAACKAPSTSFSRRGLTSAASQASRTSAAVRAPRSTPRRNASCRAECSNSLGSTAAGRGDVTENLSAWGLEGRTANWMSRRTTIITRRDSFRGSHW